MPRNTGCDVVMEAAALFDHGPQTFKKPKAAAKTNAKTAGRKRGRSIIPIGAKYYP